MTTTFSFPRLLQLIRKQWFENARLYLFSSLALLGLLGVVFTFWITTSGTHFTEDTPYLIFIFGIFISGGVFASMAFNMLGEKPKATYWLSFPASHLEKLITVIFYSTIVFFLIFCACFFVVKSAADLYINNLVLSDPSRYSYKLIKFSGSFGEVFAGAMYGFFAVQAFYLMGSIYFPRYSFVITTFIGALIIFLFVYYISKLNWDGNFMWEGTRVISMVPVNEDPLSITYRSYELSPFVSNVLKFSVKYIWAPVFWVVAWFRLKEKQV